MKIVDVYTVAGDFVICNACVKRMLLPYGADKCPACLSEGTLAWADDNMQETDIGRLLKRHYKLHRKPCPKPEEYLSQLVLDEEFGR